MKLRFITAALLLPIYAFGAEVILFVKPTGNDTTGNGLTYATAWATPQKGVASGLNTGLGTTLLIDDGTYNNLTGGSLNVTVSGTPSTPIKIEAINSNTWPSAVILTNGFNDVITMTECSNVWVSHVQIKGVFNGGRRGIYEHVYNASYKSNRVERCEISRVSYGIFLEGGSSTSISDTRGDDGFVIRSNYIHDCELIGVYTRDGQTFPWTKATYKHQNLQIVFNTISNMPGNNVVDGCACILTGMTRDPYYYGNLLLKTGDTMGVPNGGGSGAIVLAYNHGGYMAWNVCKHFRWNNNHHFDGIGINPGPACDGSLWEHNYVEDCDGGGWLDYVSSPGPLGNNVARFNTLVDCGLLNEAPIDVRGGPVSGDLVYNNTIICNKKPVVAAIWIETGGGGSGNYMLNNNVISTNQFAALQDYPTGVDWVVQGNSYWDFDGTPSWDWRSVTYNTLASWRTASGWETNVSGFSVDPLIKNRASADLTSIDQMATLTNYQLGAGSGLIGTGKDILHLYGINPGSYDANSNLISGALSVGAYSGVPPDPVIIQQPQSVQVFVNSSTNFMVVASGTPTLHYQWRVNGVNQGTDSATFTTNTVLNGANGAAVSVVVTGPGANSPVTSANAFIQVVPDPWIITQPQNATTAEGGSATFTVGALGATALTYDWTVGGTHQGVNNAILTLNNVPFLFNGAAVICNVSDSNGNTNSASATLTVNHNGPPPPYTGDPINFTLVSAMRTNLTDVVQGWIPYDVSYYPGITELNTNFDVTRAFGQIAWFTFPLPAILSPQKYKIVGGFATQNTNATIIVNAGDGWITNTFGLDVVNTWTNIGDVTSSISFSNILVGFVKRQTVGTLQNYWIAGVGALQTNYDVLAQGIYRYINTNAITTTNLVTAPGNLVPNSSFEFGLAPGGWTSGRNGTVGNETWLSNMTTNDAFNGSKAAVIGTGYGASRFQILSPPIWLRGDRNIRSYVLSFYYKNGPGGPGAAVVDWARPYSSADSGAATFTPSGSWQRFQTNLWLAPYPNRLFGFTIHHVATGPLLIDAVQFEESTNGATAYAPANQIELAVTCRTFGDPALTWRNGNVENSLDNSPGFGIQVYNNTASSSNLTGHVNIFDWQNRSAGIGNFIYTAPPGISDFFATTGFHVGNNRIYAYLDGSPAFRSEADFAYVPVPNLTTTNWSSMFGIHACEDTPLVTSNLQWGISWQRGLSPGGIVQMNEIEGASNVFNFTSTDLKVNAALANHSCVLLANMSDVSDLPAWALDGSGVPWLAPLSNYAYQVVSHYKTQIHHWESINEPMTPSGWSGATFATIETALAGAVKLADPTAFYVGFGGVGGGVDISKAETAWSAMNSTTHGQIDAISVHMYPANNSLWMGADDDPRPAAARALGVFCSKPVWNTESGSYQWPNHGDKNGGLQGIPSFAAEETEFEYRRSVYQAAELAARNWIRLLGYGVQKYFYYDGRVAGGTYGTEGGLPQWFDYADSINPIGAAYFWSAYLLDLPSYVASMTNTASTDVFGGLFAHDSGRQVIAAFTLSRSNLVMTVTNNNFAVFDLMGNLLQTNSSSVAIGRTPTYWVSSDLTSNQLVATFQSASVTASANVTAPAVSIDVSQHGNILQTNQLPFRFRWTTISPYDVNTADTPLIVLTRWRFAGLTDWTTWTADRYTELTNAPSILTHLDVQAMDAQGNVSGTFSGPDFGPNTGPQAPYNFHVSKGHVSSGHL